MLIFFNILVSLPAPFYLQIVAYELIRVSSIKSSYQQFFIVAHYGVYGKSNSIPPAMR